MLKAVNILQTISIKQFVSCTCFLLKTICILSLGYITMYVYCIYHNYGCVDKNMFFFLLICFFQSCTFFLFLAMLKRTSLSKQFFQVQRQSNPQKKNQTEEKAKVVTAGWGKELIQFHAALEIQLRFTPHQTPTLPKWLFFRKLFFKSLLLLSSDDLCLLSDLSDFFFSGPTTCVAISFQVYKNLNIL